MARLRGVVTSGEITLSESATQTLLQLIAATNHRVAVTGLQISFKSATSGNSLRVELVRQSTAGTVTSATPVKLDDSIAETILTTAGKDASAEPTTGDVLKQYLVPTQSGGIERVFGLDDEAIIGGGDRIGLRVITGAGVTPTVVAELSFEE